MKREKVRTDQILIKISPIAKRVIQREANAVDESVSEYLRRSAVMRKKGLSKDNRVDLAALRKELSAIGNNLNQAVRLMNSGTDEAHQIAALAGEIDALKKRIAQELSS